MKFQNLQYELYLCCTVVIYVIIVFKWVVMSRITYVTRTVSLKEILISYNNQTGCNVSNVIRVSWNDMTGEGNVGKIRHCVRKDDPDEK